MKQNKYCEHESWITILSGLCHIEFFF